MSKTTNDDGVETLPLFLNLPDDLLYQILTYTVLPVNIPQVLCHGIAPLCSTSRDFINSEEYDSLWELVLGGFADDLHSSNQSSKKVSSGSTRKRNHKDMESDTKMKSKRGNNKNDLHNSGLSAYRCRRQRRESKRLRRTTAKEDVIRAYFLMRDRTHLALEEIGELAVSKSQPLSLARLRGVLKAHGPLLNINQHSTIGGTFLVNCCRARCVKESVIVSSCKELIEKYGALPNIPSHESSIGHSSRNKNNHLYPLTIAAARGMSKVVKYLIQDHIMALGGGHGDSSTSILTLEGSSRFRLHSNPKKSISGTYNPVGFAQAMMNAELEHGASKEEVKSLGCCIRMLQEKMNLIEKKAV